MTAGLSPTFSSPPVSYLNPFSLSVTIVIGMTWRYRLRFDIGERVAFELIEVVTELAPALIASEDDDDVEVVIARLAAEVIEAFDGHMAVEVVFIAIEIDSTFRLPGVCRDLGQFLFTAQSLDGLVEDRLCVQVVGPGLARRARAPGPL